MSAFDWDDDNIAHIRLHGVEQQEAEDALTLQPFEFEAYPANGEERYDTLGPTRKGRILKVVATQRGVLIRVITAYDATHYCKKMYFDYLVTL